MLNLPIKINKLIIQTLIKKRKIKTKLIIKLIIKSIKIKINLIQLIKTSLSNRIKLNHKVIDPISYSTHMVDPNKLPNHY